MNSIKDQYQNIYLGTSGLVVPERNKSLFPPEFRDKSRLAYYASLFNSIEINSSFKKPPLPRTVIKWAADVPEHFRFTFKCWRGITHNKDLEFDPADVNHFFEVINHVEGKRGCLLVQFPGKLSVALKQKLEILLEVIQQNNQENKWRIAIEFRNTSWYNPAIFDFLRLNNVGLVLHDLPSSAPAVQDMTADFAYLRFHGPEKGYRGSYPDEFLHKYAQLINSWNAAGKEVFVYFNNTLGDAAKNLITLNRFIHGAKLF
jgi:uncharacterized protein YecE (DUF72 family)